jgi:hypothetical protein
MMTRQDAFNPFALLSLARRSRPARVADGALAPSAVEAEIMTRLAQLKREVPPPSPEKMAAGKQRLLERAAELRRQRLIDLAG